jgi:L-arabinonolactonase
MVSLCWDSTGACWWWADRQTGQLQQWPHRADMSRAGGVSEHWPLPDEALPLAACLSGRLLLAQPKRLCLASQPPLRGRGRSAGTLEPLLAVEPAEPRTSIHEGAIDHQGKLVFGTRNDSPDGRPIASFSQYSRRHGLRRLALPTVTAATSICFSPDGTLLYFADGALHRILQCDYDAETATVGGAREFASTAARPGPAVVDGAGMLWSLQERQLLRYHPDGSLCERHFLRHDGPAALALGGPQLDQLLLAWPGGRRTWRCAPALPTPAFDDTQPL